MDVLNVAYTVALFSAPVLAYIIFLKPDKSNRYSTPSWYYQFKKRLSRNVILTYLKRHKKLHNYESTCDKPEGPRKLAKETEEDVHVIVGSDQKGTSVLIRFSTRLDKYGEVSIQLRHDGHIYELPNSPEVLVCSMQKREWKAAGLSIESVDPYKIYRIVYNGFLKREDQIAHFKINFLWNSASKPLFYPNDFDTNLFADAISREPWRDGDWIKLVGDRIGYEQFGCLHGEVCSSLLPEGKVVLNLPSHRKRFSGIADRFETYRDVSIFLAIENGTLIHFGARSIINGSTHLRFGSVLYTDGFVDSITDNDITLQHLGECGNIPKNATFHIKTKRSTIKCFFHVNPKHQTKIISEEPWGYKLKTAVAECDINKHQGTAVMMFWYQKSGKGINMPEPLLKPRKAFYDEFLALNLEDYETKCLEMVGGKANSLALIKSLNSLKFVVPDGFVVTIPAFRLQVTKNVSLQKAVAEIKLAESDSKKLLEACQKAVKLFSSEEILPEIVEAIKSELSEIKSKIEENQEIRWAIRSSGIAEDCENISAAGQNSTFLGLESEEEIIKAVASCWASLYSFQSVQYRRQHGIPIKSEMGVVVQRMVPSETAGVLFTCHPVNSDTSRMIICSNFGIGESVVSGMSDPDTITLKRTFDGKITIEEISVGEKRTHMVLNAGDVGVQKCGRAGYGDLSLTDEQILYLADTGLYLEKKFGSPRDIEWSFYQGKLYLLQVRPIANLNSWTDYELLHELDSAVLSENNVYSTINVQEVIPGAMTALSNTAIRKNLTTNTQLIVHGHTNEFSNYCLISIRHRAFFDIYNMLLRYVETKLNLYTSAIDISTSGRRFTTEEMIQESIGRFGCLKPMTKLKLLGQMLYSMLTIFTTLRKVGKLSKEEITIRNDMTLEEMYKAIDQYEQILNRINLAHISCSQISSFYNMIMISVLSGGNFNQEFSAEHEHDISVLLSCASEAVSAKIPKSLEEIAEVIRGSSKCLEFVRLEARDGQDWLKENVPEAAEMFDRFLLVHGHRSSREFELMDDSWSANPSQIISMLQMNCRYPAVSKAGQKLSISAAIKKLKLPKSDFTRTILKYLVVKTSRAIANREKSKSYLVKSIDRLRKPYKALGQLLTDNGRIPEADLVYHLTKAEVRSLLKTHNPAIVIKAQRRQRLYSVWNAETFPEFMKGKPVPEVRNAIDVGNGLIVKGTVACQGDVTARCCCIKSMADIGQLEAGDILITCCTDTSWSPYFPMLSGLATEIGGLISHGIVVAREYGLPCLVALQDATSLFRTGDIVKLSGVYGTLQLVSKRND